MTDDTLKEGVPAVTTTCYHGHEATYSLPQVTDFGEAICPECHDIFWSTRLMDLSRLRK